MVPVLEEKIALFWKALLISLQEHFPGDIRKILDVWAPGQLHQRLYSGTGEMAYGVKVSFAMKSDDPVRTQMVEEENLTPTSCLLFFDLVACMLPPNKQLIN